MLKTKFKAWFSIGFYLICFFTVAQDKIIEKEQADIFMENEFLKIKVNRKRGGVISSLIYKPENRELTEEFNSGEFQAGGIAEDRIGGQKYIGGEISNALYQGEITNQDNYQELTLIYSSKSKTNNGLQFRKTYRLYKGQSRLEIKWTIKNKGEKETVLSPWVHNIIERSMKYTVIPKPEGIKYISGGADYFGIPWRNWIGALDKKKKLFLFFIYDYQNVVQDYYCFWNGFHTMEWVYRPIKIRPGEQWQTKYYLGIVKGINEVAYVSPKIVAGYSWDKQGLKVQMASTVPLGNVNVKSKRLDIIQKAKWHKDTNFIPGKTNVFNISGLESLSDGFKVDFELMVNGKKVKLEDDLSLPEKELYLYLVPKKNVNCSPLPNLKRNIKLYKAIKPVKHSAVFYELSNKNLELWQVSTLDKVFKNDKFQKRTKFKFPVAARRERESYQFVLKNTGKKEIRIKCTIAPFIHDKDKSSKFQVPHISKVVYVKTTVPSNMNPAYPVGYYPDPLLPQEEFIINSGENTPVWFTVEIPKNARSGIYTSYLKLNIKGKKQQVIPLKIEVADFSLPGISNLKTSYGCWNPTRKVLDKVGFTGTSMGFFELLQQMYLNYRFTPRETLIKPSIDSLEVIKTKLKYYLKSGINTFAIPKSCSPDKIKNIAKLFQHMQFKGDMYVYIADEAPADYYSKVKKDCAKFKKISKSLKTFATIYGAKPEILFGVLDIWCRGYSKEPWVKQRIKAGDEFWTVNGGLKPIEASLIENRLCYWKHKAYEFKGDLIWNCIAGYSKQNPWDSVYCSGSNGNAHLLYPTSKGPITSIRWENVSDSLEDYDYFCILENLLKKCYEKNILSSKLQKAKVLLNKIKNVDYISQMKAEDIFSFKRQIATEIVNLKRLLLPQCNTKIKYPLPPVSPRGKYDLPDKGVKVSNTHELIQQIKKTTPQTIILTPGTYTNTKYLPIYTAHKLIAEKPGTAVIHFGFSVGANHPPVDGVEFRGLKFDIQDRKKCHQGACILTWGKSKNTRIEDCWFYGNNFASAAVVARQPDGLKINRVFVRKMTDYGIMMMRYKVKDAGIPAVIENIDIAAVSRKKPRSANGTAEAGLWLGNSCKVRRVKIRDCSWMGIWTGNYCLDSLIEDFDVDSTNIGVYLEHDTENTVFQRFKIGSKTYTGINCEWGKKHGQQGASVNNLIQNGTICSRNRGIYMDEGSAKTTVRNITIENAQWGGIGMYKSPTCEVIMEGCKFKLPSETKKVRYKHWRSL